MMGTAENPYHTYLHILQNASCQEPSRGGGGDVHFPAPLPLDPPLDLEYLVYWNYSRTMSRDMSALP